MPRAIARSPRHWRPGWTPPRRGPGLPVATPDRLASGSLPVEAAKRAGHWHRGAREDTRRARQRLPPRATVARAPSRRLGVWRLATSRETRAKPAERQHGRPAGAGRSPMAMTAAILVAIPRSRGLLALIAAVLLFLGAPAAARA